MVARCAAGFSALEAPIPIPSPNYELLSTHILAMRLKHCFTPLNLPCVLRTRSAKGKGEIEGVFRDAKHIPQDWERRRG